MIERSLEHDEAGEQIDKAGPKAGGIELAMVRDSVRRKKAVKASKEDDHDIPK
jgi:NACalpha-BTF3-like transcription factor